MSKLIIIVVVVAISSAVRAEIVRPCAFYDHGCIQANLAANSNCKRNVRGYLPSKYFVKEFRFETPFFNSSYIDKNLIVKNHDKCRVSEFFYNTDTNKAVLCVDCPQLDLESDRVLIQHRSKREDELYHYHIHAEYPLIRLTLNLGVLDHMDLCKAHIFTEVVQLPRFHINPKDKPTNNFLSRDLTALNIFEREAFFYGGDRLAKAFIDSLICDYGCNRLILPHYSDTLEDNEIKKQRITWRQISVYCTCTKERIFITEDIL